MIDANDYPATAAGAAPLPLPIVITIASPTLGRFADRIGPQLPLTIGPFIVAVGFAFATRIGGAGSC